MAAIEILFMQMLSNMVVVDVKLVDSLWWLKSTGCCAHTFHMLLSAVTKILAVVPNTSNVQCLSLTYIHRWWVAGWEPHIASMRAIEFLLCLSCHCVALPDQVSPLIKYADCLLLFFCLWPGWEPMEVLVPFLDMMLANIAPEHGPPDHGVFN